MNLMAGCDCGGGDSSKLMRGLMGVLSSGSVVRVGFEFDYSLAYDPDEISSQIVSYVQGALYNYLADDVTFSNVNVAVQPPGYFASGYITVSATSRVQLPSANSFGDMVEYGLRQYLPRITVNRRDETLIDYVGPGNVGKTGVEQAGAPKVCDWNTMDFRDWFDCQFGLGKFDQLTPAQKAEAQQRAQQSNLPAAPGECVWSSMAFGEWVACQLGIKSAIGGVAAGATGAIIGVGLLAVVAVVALKR